MDRLESLTNTLSQVTLYDLKSMYNQAKNVVLNVSEMEAKVREATNDDPWGASSTLMQDIAQGTFSFQYFNEIMPCIYSRFMEKEASQWRQIYKALQLLEYIVKHGSERVVDDARSHISTIKMLRNFHYIDDKGKDEGSNVRNRARELVEMLMDVEKIRNERRKAKANKHKYTGTGNDGFGLSFESGGSRYGGFGSDAIGGSSGGGGGSGEYGSYASGGSGRSSGFRDNNGSNRREEYDAGDDDIRRPASTSTAPRSSRRAPERTGSAPAPSAPAPAPAPVPEVDLLGGLDDTPAPPPSVNKALPTVSRPSLGFDDDDFDDFQAAPTPATQAPAKTNIMDLLASSSTTARPAQPQRSNTLSGLGMGASASAHRTTPSLGGAGFGAPMQPQQSAQSAFGGVPLNTTSPTTSGFGGLGAPLRATTATSTLQPNRVGGATATTGAAAPKPAASANFDDLWNMSLGGGGSSTATGKKPAVKSMMDLQKEKANSGLWGGNSGGGQARPGAGSGFGSFGSAGGNTASGGDDLLL